MNYKRYLLIAGYDFYPQHDTSDWIDSFASFEEAMEGVENIKTASGKSTYKIRDNEYDWYHIEDLHNWLYKK